jgi:pantoate--beta-alanine ligase
MQIAKNRHDLMATRRSWKEVGFVPTMGALHSGHGALIQLAKTRCDRVIVSLFVNPTQFSKNEDLATYPNCIDDDIQKCRNWGVDCVFVPSIDDIYPNHDYAARYTPPATLATILCGVSRPHFFYGVCNVVERLLDLVNPTHAFFGDKDLQQRIVIERMVRDLNLPITIIGVPIQRNNDGIAYSSRLLYLNESGYKRAIAIYNALQAGIEMSKNPLLSGADMTDWITQQLLSAGLTVDYVSVFRPSTGAVICDDPQPGDHCCLAVYCDGVRLIDNAPC